MSRRLWFLDLFLTGCFTDWEQTETAATLIFSPVEVGRHTRGRELAVVGDDAFRRARDVSFEGRYLVMGRGAGLRGSEEDAQPKKKPKLTEIVWLQQELDDAVTASGVGWSYSHPGPAVVTLHFKKTQPGTSLSRLLKGEMSEADVRRMRDEKLKIKLHPEILQAFVDTWGPKLRLLVKSIEVTNKARYCAIEVTTPGGTVFDVGWREGGAGVASDSFDEYYCEDFDGELPDDYYDTPHYREAYRNECEGQMWNLVLALTGDVLNEMMSHLESSSLHMGCGKIKMVQNVRRTFLDRSPPIPPEVDLDRRLRVVRTGH